MKKINGFRDWSKKKKKDFLNISNILHMTVGSPEIWEDLVHNSEDIYLQRLFENTDKAWVVTVEVSV